MKKIIYRDYYNFNHVDNLVSLTDQRREVIANTKEPEVPFFPDERLTLTYNGNEITDNSPKCVVKFANMVYTKINQVNNTEMFDLWTKGGFNFNIKETSKNSADIEWTCPIELDDYTHENGYFYIHCSISVEVDVESGDGRIVLGEPFLDIEYKNNTGFSDNKLLDFAMNAFIDIFTSLGIEDVSCLIGESENTDDRGKGTRNLKTSTDLSDVPEEESLIPSNAYNLCIYDYKDGPQGIIPPKEMFKKDFERLAGTQDVSIGNAFNVRVKANGSFIDPEANDAAREFIGLVYSQFSPYSYKDIYDLWSENEFIFEFEKISENGANVTWLWESKEYVESLGTSGYNIDIMTSASIETDTETGDPYIVVDDCLNCQDCQYPMELNELCPCFRELLESFAAESFEELINE